jgi:hypothetical protein
VSVYEDGSFERSGRRIDGSCSRLGDTGDFVVNDAGS